MLGDSVGCNTSIIVRIMEPFSFLAAVIVKVPEIQGVGEGISSLSMAT